MGAEKASNPAADFGGLHVAALESRHAAEMARMIQRAGGVAHVSPSLREAPIEHNREAIDFAHRLLTGQIDVVAFMTGVGVKQFVVQTERHVDRKRMIAALTDVVTIARGPKPVAALKELSVEPTFRVAEPNTWREVLALIDQRYPVAQQSVGIIEYGQSNASLIAGFEARGAKVESVKLYRYDLPVDLAPLEANVRAMARGQIDVLLVTSAHQAVNLLRVAERLQLTEELRRALGECVVASIGPVASATLRELELPVDLQAEHSKMGHLVQAAARDSGELRRRKRLAGSLVVKETLTPRPGAWDESLFMRACRREEVERTPIWLMRQAGRYMSEYRQVRDKVSFLELCRNSDLCAEVMITAVNRLGVDAAIIFADLLPILEPMGFELEFAQGEGPVIRNPVREASDVDRVTELESMESLHFVAETVRKTRSGLPATIPVIGFAGAPFTLASYTIEGGSSRSFLHAKTLMYRDWGAWEALLSRLARSVARYLNVQIAAGAQAVQLFDSWAGTLGPEDYRRYVFPFTKAVIDSISPETPVIHFCTGNPALLPLQAEAGGTVIGVDWRIDLDEAWRTIGYDKAVQGNLDPAVLLADQAEIRRRAETILRQAAGRPGHIFNLGHGIHPQTPVENVIALVEAVKELSRR